MSPVNRLNIPYQFARVYHSPRLGQIVVVDDPATVSSDKLVPTPLVTAAMRGQAPFAVGYGYMEIYVADDKRICCHTVAREPVAAQIFSSIFSATEDQQPHLLEKLLEMMHRESPIGQLGHLGSIASPEARHTPYAKIIQTRRFGDVLVMRDGLMNDPLPHIMIRWRPHAPCLATPLTVISSLPKGADRENPTPAQIALGREHLIERFAQIGRAEVEGQIEDFLDEQRKKHGPVLHHFLG